MYDDWNINDIAERRREGRREEERERDAISCLSRKPLLRKQHQHPNLQHSLSSKQRRIISADCRPLENGMTISFTVHVSYSAEKSFDSHFTCIVSTAIFTREREKRECNNWNYCCTRRLVLIVPQHFPKKQCARVALVHDCPDGGGPLYLSETIGIMCRGTRGDNGIPSPTTCSN